MQSLEERLKTVEYDSKTLIDRWMSQKMLDAERLNEVLINLLPPIFREIREVFGVRLYVYLSYGSHKYQSRVKISIHIDYIKFIENAGILD